MNWIIPKLAMWPFTFSLALNLASKEERFLYADKELKLPDHQQPCISKNMSNIKQVGSWCQIWRIFKIFPSFSSRWLWGIEEIRVYVFLRDLESVHSLIVPVIDETHPSIITAIIWCNMNGKIEQFLWKKEEKCQQEIFIFLCIFRFFISQNTSSQYFNWIRLGVINKLPQEVRFGIFRMPY